MNIALEFILIFALGSITGWFIEVIGRSFEKKKLVNPGFLSGPYLPIYGFGTLLLYGISSLEIHLVYIILLITVSTTFLELITGIIFIGYYKIKLWDYSENFLNYKGLICPLYSFFWTMFGIMFYFFIYPKLFKIIGFFDSIPASVFLLGIFYGLFIFDLINSFKIAFKIRQFVTEFNENRILKLRINYFLLKVAVRARLKKFRQTNPVERFFFTLNNAFQNEAYEQLRKNMLKFRKKSDK